MKTLHSRSNSIFKLFFLGLVCLFSSCTDNDSQFVESRIRLGMFPKISHFSPLESNSDSLNTYWPLIYSQPFIQDRKGIFEPQLVKSFSPEQNGKVWEIRIRSDLIYNDGSTLTAEDLAWTIESYNESDGLHHRYFPVHLIHQVEVIDKFTIKLELNQPNYQFLKYLTFPVLSKSMHLDNGQRTDRIPMGTGNYTIAKADHDRILLKLREESEGNLDVIEGVFYNTGDELWNALLKGELDGALSLTHQQIQSLKNLPEFQIHRVRSPYLYYLGFNCQTYPLDDHQLRKALMEIVNRNPLPREFQSRCYGPWYADTVERSEKSKRSVSHIKNALISSGYSIESGRLVRNGSPVDFSIIIWEGDRDDLKLAFWIKESLRLLGLFPHIEVVPNDEFFKRLEAGDFQAIIYPMRSDMPSAYWHSTSITNGYNATRYSNNEVDQILEHIEREPDVKNEEDLRQALIRAFEEDPPGIFLYWDEWEIVVSSDYDNVIINPFYTLADIGQWRKVVHEK